MAIYRLAIDPTAVTGTHATGYVQLITEASIPASHPIWSVAVNGGGDLRFYADDAKTQALPLEVVSFDTLAKTCILRTRHINQVDDTTGGECWIEATGSGTQPPVTDPSGRNAVYQDDALFYNLDGDTGATIIDSSGNDDGALQGSVALGAAVAPYGSSTDLAGTGYYNGIYDPVAGAARMYSSFWINSAGGGSSGISGSYVSNSDASYLIYVSSSTSTLRFRIPQGGAAVEVGSTAEVYDDGLDHFVQCRYDGAQMELWVDGALENNEVRAGAIGAPTSAPFNVGAWNDDLIRSPDARVQRKLISTSSKYTQDYLQTEYSNESNSGAFAQLEDPGPSETVSAELVDSWSVFEAVNTGLLDSWSVFAVVSTSLVDGWQVYNAVSSPIADAWTIQGAISSFLTDEWSVFNSVSVGISDSWTIGGATSVTLSDSWTVYNITGSPLTDEWRVLTTVSVTLTDEWAIYTTVSTELTDQWDIGGLINAVLTDSWRIGVIVPSRNYTFSLTPRKLSGRLTDREI